MSLTFDISLAKGDFALAAKCQLPADSVTAIVGPSGSGKTTLLRSLAGLERAACGSVRFGGETWLDSPNKIALPPHHRRVGYVFQHAALFQHLSVSQNIEYAAKRAKKPSRHSTQAIIDATRVGRLLDRAPATLSGGERQRVALARVLVSNPQLLMLDEPLSALDETSRHELIEELQAIFRDLCLPVLYVTHNQAEAAYLAHHVLTIQNGRVSAFGPVREILAPRQTADPDASAPFTILSGKERRDLPEYALAEIETEIGVLTLPANSIGQGVPQRLLVHARDVGISLQPLQQTSFLNHLPARIESLAPFAAGQTLLKLRCRDGILHALVTNKSAETLQLAPDKPVFTLIKSVTLSPHFQ